MLAEVAPVGIGIAEALGALGPLCALIFCLGCVFVVEWFVRALFGTLSGAVGWIPFGGRVVQHSVHAIEHKITNALGSAEATIDRYIAVSWHKLATVVRRIGNDLIDTAGLLLGIAAALLYLAPKKLVHYLIRVATMPLRVGLHTVEREFKGIEHGLERLALRVERWVIPRVRAAEHALDVTLPRDLAALRHRARVLEGEYTRIWRWIKTHPWDVATTAFVGAVAVALARLGGGWIRCRNWNRIGRHVCGLPVQLIEDLLGLTAAALALRDLCRLVDLIEGLAIRVQPEIEALVLELEGFICGGTDSLPTGIVRHDLQRIGSLPSGIVDADLAAPASFAGF